MSTSSNERGMSLRSPARFLAPAERLVEQWQADQDPAFADRVADAWIKAQAYRLHTFGTVTRLAAGGELGAESSITKVFWSDLDVALHQTALDLRGADGELVDSWTDGLLFALGGPIYAGTNEIQRNIIAERLLGLPARRRAASEIRSRRTAARLRREHRRGAWPRPTCPPRCGRGPAGDTGPGRKVWSTLADLGVTALMVPEKFDGIEAHPVDLVVAAERLGYWGVPGPVTESIAVAPILLADDERSGALAAGELIATVALPPHGPAGRRRRLRRADPGRAATARCATAPRATRTSPSTRRASCSTSARSGEPQKADTARAFEFGALATAAQLVGAGQAMLDASVEYAKQRSQFGRVIGSYQAIKHKLADVYIAVELARPLVYGAALSLADGLAGHRTRRQRRARPRRPTPRCSRRGRRCRRTAPSASPRSTTCRCCCCGCRRCARRGAIRRGTGDRRIGGAVA